MNILIIGAKGFIGSHLVEFYRSQNHHVISCDIKDLKEENYVSVDKYNSDFNPVFTSHKIDACVFAGGNGSVPYSIENPEIDFQLNTHTVDSVLVAMRKHSPGCRFIHISSAAVYGSPSKLPIDENETVKPQSPYGWHKYLSECLCRKYHSLYGMHTSSIRVFSVFGERLRKQLFWDIFQKIKKSRDILLFGSGNESRDFIYISDLVQAIDCVLRNGAFKAEAINVASGEEITIKTAATTFCRLYDPALKVSFTNEVKPGDPSNWWADIGRLKGLGFRPSVSLEQGLGNYVKWLKENE